MGDGYRNRQLANVALVANAVRPLPGAPASIPAFFAGWLSAELAPHLLAVTAADTAVTQLSFGPSGTLLAVLDSAGVVRVWDLAAMRSILKVTRPKPVKAIAFGPTDDVLLLADGKAVDLWHLPELAKQP